jgi:hypothetical protein
MKPFCTYDFSSGVGILRWQAHACHAGKAELMPEALVLFDNFQQLQHLELLSPLEDLEPLMSSSTAAVETSGCTPERQGSWTSWAASGFGLFSSGSNGNAAAAAAAPADVDQRRASSTLATGSSNISGSGGIISKAGSGSWEKSSLNVRTAGVGRRVSNDAVVSPLALDMRQQAMRGHTQQQQQQQHDLHLRHLPGQLKVVAGRSRRMAGGGTAAASSRQYARLLGFAHAVPIGVSRTSSDGAAALDHSPQHHAAAGLPVRHQSLDREQQQQQQGVWPAKLMHDVLSMVGPGPPNVKSGQGQQPGRAGHIHDGLIDSAAVGASLGELGRRPSLSDDSVRGTWSRMLLGSCQVGKGPSLHSHCNIIVVCDNSLHHHKQHIYHSVMPYVFCAPV